MTEATLFQDLDDFNHIYSVEMTLFTSNDRHALRPTVRGDIRSRQLDESFFHVRFVF